VGQQLHTTRSECCVESRDGYASSEQKVAVCTMHHMRNPKAPAHQVTAPHYPNLCGLMQASKAPVPPAISPSTVPHCALLRMERQGFKGTKEESKASRRTCVR
jgi:hypothetical protein